MKIWGKIVILHPEDENNERIEINDSKEAARVLLNSWPAVQGRSYRRAVLNCSAAVDGRVPQDTAQWAFIVAVMEAAIPYAILDRLDAEIGAVCRKMLDDDASPRTFAVPVEAAAPTPIFWWPKRGERPERPRLGFPDVAASQA